MPDTIFSSPSPFVAKKRGKHVAVIPVAEKDYKSWLKKQNAAVKRQAQIEGFPKIGAVFFVYDAKGGVKEIFAGVNDGIKLYDLAPVADALRSSFAQDFIKKTSFEIKGPSFDKDALTRAHIGWGLACYQFTQYKSKAKQAQPMLLISGKADKKRVQAFVESIYILRNLINTPANDLAPMDIAAAAKKIAAGGKAKIKITTGAELKKQFPMVHAVGESSSRKPCLIDLKWGNPKNPKVTLVGKGVVFDTGGVDIKPAKAMELMKKDMAGGAHVLAMAKIIMALRIPVRLRVIVPAVENSVSDTAFRPSDVFKSRKGIMIENTNTDAEGRLILSDALALACEENPDLIIDYATLTGSARVALGFEVPAMFSNNDNLAKKLQKIAMDNEDPLWQMPLWQPYKRLIKSSVGDIINSTGQPGDLIYSALFLEHFVSGKADWVHLDLFAWEPSGKPGRPRGGTDMGLRAVIALIEEKYGR